ncbi:MAG: ATP-binding protein, partial [Elusimicrobia bacterium]|nr:ATP-binding protein [Elusimicrobiota bacterium]
MTAALILTAPGIDCYQAIAQNVSRQGGHIVSIGGTNATPILQQLQQFLTTPSVEGLQHLQTAARLPGAQDSAIELQRVSAALLYHLLSHPEVISSQRNSLERLLGSAHTQTLESTAMMLQNMARQDKNLKQLLSSRDKNPVATLETLSLLYDGITSKPGFEGQPFVSAMGGENKISNSLSQSASKPVPLARLVSFLVASQETDRQMLAEAIQKGEEWEPLLTKAPGRVEYWRDLIDDFSHSQFADQTRPIVELITNSIDAVQGEFPKEVEVNVDPQTGSLILDRGRGMNLKEVLEKLLVPLLSGKEGQDLIGRFGVGFYSVLQYLSTPGDSIQIETSDGQEAIRIILQRVAGQPHVSFENLPKDSPRGTHVSLRHPLSVPEVGSMISETLKFNTKAKIFFNGERVNPPEFQRTEGKQITFLYNNLGESRVYVTLNGVTLFSRKLSGKNIPGTLVVNFPVQTQLAVSRNMLLVDEFTRGLARQAVDLAASQKDPYPFLNGLVPILAALQANNPSPKIEDNLEIYLRETVTQLVGKEGKPLLPDTDDMHGIDLESPIYLHPSLFNSIKDYKWSFPAYTGFKPSLFGKRYAMLLAPFKKEDKVLAQYGNLLFLNQKHVPKTFAGKAILQALLQVKGLAGRVHVPWGLRDILTLLSTPIRWVSNTLVTFLPSQIMGVVYKLKEVLTGPLRANGDRKKGFTEKEQKEFAQTMTSSEKIVWIGLRMLTFWSMFHYLSKWLPHFFSLLLSPDLAILIGGIFGTALALVLWFKYLNKFVDKTVVFLMHKLRPYKPFYSAFYFYLVPIILVWILPSLSKLPVELYSYVFHGIDFLFVLPLILFLISIWKAVFHLLRLTFSSLGMLARSIPLAWRWFSLPQEM